MIGVPLELLVDHHFLSDEHIKLHVTMIFSPDVQRIHSNIAVSGCLHTDGGRGAAAYDADEGEYEEEESILSIHGTV